LAIFLSCKELGRGGGRKFLSSFGLYLKVLSAKELGAVFGAFLVQKPVKSSQGSSCPQFEEDEPRILDKGQSWNDCAPIRGNYLQGKW
jgi:hypothetical protein